LSWIRKELKLTKTGKEKGKARVGGIHFKAMKGRHDSYKKA